MMDGIYLEVECLKKTACIRINRKCVMIGTAILVLEKKEFSKGDFIKYIPRYFFHG